MRGQWYRNGGKRLLDLVLAISVFVLAWPVLGIIAWLVRLDSPGPVLFIQERLGLGGQVFCAYKFRTMIHRPRVSDHEIIGRDAEVTRIGYWVRRFKLDELLQLVNVITGDMSIVGPRPALPEQLLEYDEVGRKRLEVRPGLTGLAQVHGNIHLSWPERWRYDAAYVEHLSLWIDLWILWRTLAVVMLGEGRFIKRPVERDEW